MFIVLILSGIGQEYTMKLFIPEFIPLKQDSTIPEYVSLNMFGSSLFPFSERLKILNSPIANLSLIL